MGGKVMDDLKAFRVPVLILSGGEPLLRSDIFDLAQYGTDKGFRMVMATNGTLFTDENIRKMKASGIQSEPQARPVSTCQSTIVNLAH